MESNIDYAYIAAIAFISILILDFFVIEIVLRLGVFSHGKAILRVIMIIALEIHASCFFISNMYPELALKTLIVGTVCFVIWNPLYYYMLIEQNTYWMKSKVKKVFYLAFLLFLIWMAIMGIATILVGLGVAPFSFLSIVHFLDLVAMIYISLTEFYLNYQIYKFSKKALLNVSHEFWEKVKMCLLLFTFCILLDIAIVLYENSTQSSLAYIIRPCSFAFKTVFECMCFQFIKGIVVSIER